MTLFLDAFWALISYFWLLYGLNPITVRGGRLLMSMSGNHFKTILSTLKSGLSKNWRPFKLWSPEIFGAKFFFHFFFLKINFFVPHFSTKWYLGMLTVDPRCHGHFESI